MSADSLELRQEERGSLTGIIRPTAGPMQQKDLPRGRQADVPGTLIERHDASDFEM